MKVVLHICCGVCATSVAERLIAEGHQIMGLFYNPNIHPMPEYTRRLDTAHKVGKELGFLLEEGPYVPENWFIETDSFKNEPEGGKRCEACFRFRLSKTYLYTLDSGYDAFTTTLTVSSHKSAELINKIGKEIGEDKFLIKDFKKKEGFKRSIELAKQWNLYRQNYCGCIYSRS